MEYKNIFKIGEMFIDIKQVFWKRQYIYACIPFLQITSGHVLIVPRRQVYNYKQLEPAEVFDLSLSIKFITKSLENYFNCNSSTIYIQNSTKQEGQLGHLIVHVIPRIQNDLKNNEELYSKINEYPKQIMQYYNEKINLYRNAYTEKIFEGIQIEAKKYEEYLNTSYKQEQQF